ncbi:Spy/CpxP family protein refolding chaperone [Hippea maritima]|uniref:Uncharacterized protein n=1 Tax=Hippea maritima (strain ATCC 700847 / DSM 10411 / MH2) TaxID=760142 RepID=F2LY66_HIPMA|nr:Spy/CpxP family protein refolding chaperone [Hippea maritima]AEA34389.1 hypothetical protein Hipma_1433 [Hippea maritima DSM 10411]
MKKALVSFLLGGALLSSGAFYVNTASARLPMQGSLMRPMAQGGMRCANFQGGPYHSKAMMGYNVRGIKFMETQLNLTPAQVKKIEDLRYEYRSRFMTKNTRYKMPLNDALKANGFNRKVFVDESMQNAKMRIKQRAEYMDKFFSILTPQQREKFIQLRRQRMEFALKNARLQQRAIQSRIKFLESNIQQ